MNLIERFHHWRRRRRWNKQYRRGRWDSLQSDKETKRYGQIIAFIDKYGPADPSVLDIGCGDGVLTQRIKPGSYQYFLGVDYAQASIEKARKRQLPQAEFEVADALQFDPPREFDVIIFNEAFYYIEDSHKSHVLDRMLAKLTKNGVLIVSIYREGTGCWEYFKAHPKLRELDFVTVRTDEELRYWKIGAYRRG